MPLSLGSDRPSPGTRFLETYSIPGRGADPAVSVRRYERVLLGTWNVILLVDRPGEPVSGEALDRAAAAALELMTRLEEELSKFLPESEVALMNALAASRPVAVSPTLYELLEKSRRYWRDTRGAFDPTVGPLMRLWGFDSGRGRVPDDREIALAREVCGMDRVRLEPGSGAVSFDRPGVAVDLGAIGKGYIVDRAAALLRERGARDGALLSGGSTIAVWGSPPGGGRWRVGVADPQEPGEDLLEIEVAEGTVSTSAATERRFRIEGREYGHILDPRSGRPASRCLGVTVWTPEAMRGDVASTALFVLGREEGEAVLDALAPLSAVFIESDPSRWGGLRSTVVHRGPPGFAVVK